MFSRLLARHGRATATDSSPVLEERQNAETLCNAGKDGLRHGIVWFDNKKNGVLERSTSYGVVVIVTDCCSSGH